VLLNHVSESGAESEDNAAHPEGPVVRVVSQVTRQYELLQTFEPNVGNGAMDP
jgi:hypothetical protein